MAHGEDNDDPVMRAAAVLLEAAREPSLTLSKWGVLACIAEHPGKSVKEIAACLSSTKPAVSVLVSELVGAGLVARDEDPADRRLVRLTLTEAGSEVVRRIALMDEAPDAPPREGPAA